MRKLAVFNSVTLDGYFAGPDGDMSWAHKQDPEWNAFVAENAKGESEMVFGRITYQMMAGWWPTPQAIAAFKDVADGMNKAKKVVFSRTLATASWSNTRLVKDDLTGEIRRMKQAPGPDLMIFGSGSIIAQLAPHGLIDEYQIVINPILLGAGKSMFAGIPKKLALKHTQTRTFGNGNVMLWYQPTA
jgi:dihydrofolate reductase